MKRIIKTLAIASMFSLPVQAETESHQSFEELLPQFITWAEGMERTGIRQGTPLNKHDLSLAREIGIKAPEKIRVLQVERIPYPYENAALKAMGESVGLIGEGIINNAQVFGYSIYVRKGYEFNLPQLAHELVHVLQIERASFGEVVVQHISDLGKYDYANAPLEAEAFKANIKYALK